MILPPPPARVAFLHAHPDDETLATGVLLAELVAEDYDVAVVTATRGEQGEVVQGPLAAMAGTPELVTHREGELAGALAELGVTAHAWLGTPPARAAGLQPRRYTDSGMRWVTAALAGASDSAGADSLTMAQVVEAAADLAAYLEHFGAAVLISYDAAGGYGHPDHVACHHIASAAAALTGVQLAEIASESSLPLPGAEPHHLPQHLPAVKRALSHHASQLTLDGEEVVHVGGQRQAILTTVWLVGS